MREFIQYMISIILIIFLAFLLGIGSMVYTGIGTIEEGANIIKEKGVKAIVDRVWCGEKGCEK